MIRATDTSRPATTHIGRAVAGLAIMASLTVGSLTMAGGLADAATGSPAPHNELCYLIDLYHRAEPDSAAKFRLHEEIEELLPW
jgi:predicted transcriptional regulator